MTSFTTEAAFYARYLMKKIRLTSDVDEIRKLYMGMVPRLVGISDGMFELILDKIKVANWPTLFDVLDETYSGITKLAIDETFGRRFYQCPSFDQ